MMAKTAIKQKKDRTGIGGRKPLWETMDMPSKLDAVKGWALQGSTDEEMYTMLDISKDTFYKWKNEFPEFSESIKKGKLISNGEILNSAFKQSVGFEYVEEQVFKLKSYELMDDGTGQKKLMQIEKLETVPVIRISPPNPTMSIFMLKNRLPEDYKDKQEVETKIDANVTVKLEGELNTWAN